MRELDFINTWLGGHAVSIAGAKALLKGRHERSVTICEIGCGGGDNLWAISKWLYHNGIECNVIGIDWLPAAIDTASQRRWTCRNEWFCNDYREVTFHARPDLVFSSLFCHHFTNMELTAQLQWMHVTARVGFFINDLHRHRVAYWSIKVLTGLFSRSRLVRNDAPLSVLRGFTRTDWRLILSTAGLPQVRVQWRWAFRFLLIGPNQDLVEENSKQSTFLK